jgi:hypothetical protein
MFVVLLLIYLWRMFFLCLDAKETKIIHGVLLFFGIHESSISSLNSCIPKIIGRISLSWPQPLVFHTRLRGHFLRPALKFLAWFCGLATIREGRGRWLRAFLLFFLMKKVTKKYSWVIIVFWYSWIFDFKPEYFYPKNHRTDFPIATPAVRAAHSTPGSLPYGQRANPYRDFLDKNIRATRGRWWRAFFFCLDAKETKNHQTDFPIATPAVRAAYSTPGSLLAASA